MSASNSWKVLVSSSLSVIQGGLTLETLQAQTFSDLYLGPTMPCGKSQFGKVLRVPCLGPKASPAAFPDFTCLAGTEVLLLQDARPGLHPDHSVPMHLRSRTATVGRALLSASHQDAQLYSQCLLNELEHVEMTH